MLELHWPDAPTSIRILLFCLSLALIWAIIRALNLAWRLFSVRRKRMSIEDLRSDSIRPDVFAESAFANQVRFEPISAGNTQPDKSRGTADDRVVLQALRIADIKFHYIFGSSKMKTAALKRLLWLTALVSSFVLVSSAVPTWREFAFNSKLTGVEALLEAMPRLFDWASFALAACTILCVIWASLERTLLRRQVCWQYFYSRTSNELSSDGWKSDTLQAPTEK
jgi:hypothetical protein